MREVGRGANGAAYDPGHAALSHPALTHGDAVDKLFKHTRVAGGRQVGGARAVATEARGGRVQRGEDGRHEREARDEHHGDDDGPATRTQRREHPEHGQRHGHHAEEKHRREEQRAAAQRTARAAIAVEPCGRGPREHQPRRERRQREVRHLRALRRHAPALRARERHHREAHADRRQREEAPRERASFVVPRGERDDPREHEQQRREEVDALPVGRVAVGEERARGRHPGRRFTPRHGVRDCTSPPVATRDRVRGRRAPAPPRQARAPATAPAARS